MPGPWAQRRLRARSFRPGLSNLVDTHLDVIQSNIQVLGHQKIMVGAQEPAVASGYFIGQLRYRTFPLSQKVLLARPEAHLPRRAAHRKAGQTLQRCGVQRPCWQKASGKVMIRGRTRGISLSSWFRGSVWGDVRLCALWMMV